MTLPDYNPFCHARVVSKEVKVSLSGDSDLETRLFNGIMIHEYPDIFKGIPFNLNFLDAASPFYRWRLQSDHCCVFTVVSH